MVNARSSLDHRSCGNLIMWKDSRLQKVRYPAWRCALPDTSDSNLARPEIYGNGNLQKHTYVDSRRKRKSGFHFLNYNKSMILTRDYKIGHKMPSNYQPFNFGPVYVITDDANIYKRNLYISVRSGCWWA